MYICRYLANGESYSSASYRFRISQCRIGIIVHEILKLIYTALNQRFLKFPKKADWLKISEDFETKKKFPNCIGALDGKHIRIKKPSSTGSMFYNYKQYHSIVLMALVDANYKFTMINVGSFGRISDGGVLNNSPFGKLLYEKKLDLPSRRPLHENGEPMPYVVVADEAFRLSENLLKPYPRRNLSQEKRIFNYHLSHARQMVECTFGILVSKFRIFETSIAISPEKVDSVVKAACLLHNIIKTIDSEEEDLLLKNINYNLGAAHNIQMSRNANQSSREARHVRESFMTYFSGAGAVPWQEAAVNK